MSMGKPPTARPPGRPTYDIGKRDRRIALETRAFTSGWKPEDYMKERPQKPLKFPIKRTGVWKSRNELWPKKRTKEGAQRTRAERRKHKEAHPEEYMRRDTRRNPNGTFAKPSEPKPIVR